MKENETIVEMITRFTDIVNVIRKIDEDIEVTSIKVAYKRHRNSRSKDLTKLPMEELLGSLMTYEINLAKKLQEGEDKRRIT
ncbi:hypothetical protein AAG906_004973 [Vitis piasezkii]